MAFDMKKEYEKPKILAKERHEAVLLRSGSGTECVVPTR